MEGMFLRKGKAQRTWREVGEKGGNGNGVCICIGRKGRKKGGREGCVRVNIYRQGNKGREMSEEDKEGRCM